MKFVELEVSAERSGDGDGFFGSAKNFTYEIGDVGFADGAGNTDKLEVFDGMAVIGAEKFSLEGVEFGGF